MIQITNDLKGKPLKMVKDASLPICWNGPKPFTYFKTLALSFTKSKNAQLQLPPPAYLIVTVSTFKDYELLLFLSLFTEGNRWNEIVSNKLSFSRNMAMPAWGF